MASNESTAWLMDPSEPFTTNERKPTRGHVVGCKEIIGEGHHKAASALYKDDLKSLEQPPCGAIDYFERNIATVEAGGELRRAGVAEYQRSGGMVEVDIHRLHAHNAAVKLDILGKSLLPVWTNFCVTTFFPTAINAAASQPVQ